jgi:molybdopterin molybdotransferase
MDNPSPAAPFFDVRMRGFSARTAVDDVVGMIRDRVRTLPAEPVGIEDAAGRVLAGPVISPIAVPHFDRAAFDGYALRAAETSTASSEHPITLRVAGEALPARPFGRAIEPGEAVRIMTGAPMPVGTDAVYPFELAIEADGILNVVESTTAGKNVGHIGEDVPAGRTVLNAGRVLRPQDLGLLSSIGVGTVDVVRRPRVALLVTGDELLPPGSKPEGCRIVDSNSVVLRALAERDGGDVLPRKHVPDRPNLICAAMMANDWDVLLVSGGTSVGREDHAPKLVAELGELPVHGVAVRPASPTGVGFIGDRPVFLLPGNPAATVCAYDLFAGRAIRLLGGRSDALPYPTVERPVAKQIHSVAGRVEYVRVIDGPNGIESVKSSGASILSSTVVADGFVLVPPDREELELDERVTVYLYDLPSGGSGAKFS